MRLDLSCFLHSKKTINFLCGPQIRSMLRRIFQLAAIKPQPSFESSLYWTKPHTLHSLYSRLASVYLFLSFKCVRNSHSIFCLSCLCFQDKQNSTHTHTPKHSKSFPSDTIFLSLFATQRPKHNRIGLARLTNNREKKQPTDNKETRQFGATITGHKYTNTQTHTQGHLIKEKPFRKENFLGCVVFAHTLP